MTITKKVNKHELNWLSSNLQINQGYVCNLQLCYTFLTYRMKKGLGLKTLSTHKFRYFILLLSDLSTDIVTVNNISTGPYADSTTNNYMFFHTNYKMMIAYILYDI